MQDFSLISLNVRLPPSDHIPLIPKAAALVDQNYCTADKNHTTGFVFIHNVVKMSNIQLSLPKTRLVSYMISILSQLHATFQS